MFLPEVLEGNVVAVEDVSLGFAHIGDANRKRATRPQSAFAVPSVLPKMPIVPRRRAARLGVIVGDPEPAVGKNRPVACARAAAVKHSSQTVFTAVDPGIFSRTLFDSLHECHCLPDAHRTSAIMRVLFEIEYEQNAGPVLFLVGRRINNRMG